MPDLPRILLALFCCLMLCSPAPAAAQEPAEADREALAAKLAELQDQVGKLKAGETEPALIADVEVYAKAVDWALRHKEFYSPEYTPSALKALDTGLARAAELAAGKASWPEKTGRLIRGYVSEVDHSVQPYAVSVPPTFKKQAGQRWPLHVVLHGRGDKLNEIAFIRSHDGQTADIPETWIQLDVFARTNNGYRWAGETDVFEAMAALKKEYRIDNRRIVLRGFSMGGAGSWHLGLHHPSLWCSVGPGAGFVDFYNYQNVTEKLPAYQDLTLRIYDSLDYVRNAFDVPVCTYGGELDPQLIASTAMVSEAEKLEIPIKLVIGKEVGHKFTPEGFREYMDFHVAQMEKGRPIYPGRQRLKFVTYTLKYNTCEWVTVEEMIEPYRPATVEGHVDSAGVVHIKTDNIAVLSLARDIASQAIIDGSTVEVTTAAQGLLPKVYYELGADEWSVISYDSSLAFNKNLDRRKRHNLQGPIDDAFMQPFLCVRGTGTPWSEEHEAWARWTLSRFEREFDKWLRGKIRIIDDKDITEEQIADHHIVLFGDPGSNSLLAKIAKQLPIKWDEKSLLVDGETYDPATHGVALIYPNPLSPRHYVVLNSGHSFHEAEFKASNAQLYPRLGDIAVLKFEKTDAGYAESTVWAELFNAGWRLPKAVPEPQRSTKGAEKSAP